MKMFLPNFEKGTFTVLNSNSCLVTSLERSTHQKNNDPFTGAT